MENDYNERLKLARKKMFDAQIKIKSLSKGNSDSIDLARANFEFNTAKKEYAKILLEKMEAEKDDKYQGR